MKAPQRVGVSVMSGVAPFTLTPAVSASPAVILSGRSDTAAVVMLLIDVPAAETSTLPSNVKVALAPFGRLAIVQSPEISLYVPVVTVPLFGIATRPVGRSSVSETFVVLEGPLFVIVISKATTSPISGFGFPEASVLTVTRSASCKIETDSVASKSSSVPIAGSADIVAVFVMSILASTSA